MKSEPLKKLVDYSVNIKTKLAFLWSSLMLLYIYADYFEMMTPEKIKKMMNLRTPAGPATPGLLVIFSVVLIVPALMISLSAFAKPTINKWANIVFGLLYAAISIWIIISDLGDQWQAFFVLYNVIELCVLAVIIQEAWEWPRSQANNRGEQI